jgi:hypothetical protein
MSVALAFTAANREAVLTPFEQALPIGGKELAILAVSAGGFLLFVLSAFLLRAVTFGEIRRALVRDRAQEGQSGLPGSFE